METEQFHSIETQALSPQEKERSAVKINIKSATFDEVKEVQDALIHDSERKLIASVHPPEKDLALVDFPPALQTKMQKMFSNLSKFREKTITLLQEKATTTYQKDRLIGAMFQEIEKVKAEVEEIAKNPVFLNTAPESLKEMEIALRQYEGVFAPEMYSKFQKGPTDDVKKQASTAGRLLLVTVAGAYTLYAGIMGWKSGNLGPAMAGAAVTAASIFGIKRLMGGKGDRVISEMKFLENGEYDDFMRSYGIMGSKKWADYIRDDLSTQPKRATIARLRAIVNKKRNPKIHETAEAFEKEKIEAAMDMLNGNKDPEIHDALTQMLTAGREDDIARLLAIANPAHSQDTKDTIHKYITCGGTAHLMKIAQNPQMLGDQNPAGLGDGMMN